MRRAVRRQAVRDHGPMRGKRILIIGGTGSLGIQLITALHRDNDLVIFSRDEEKQWRIQHHFAHSRLKFVIGDIRDYDSLYTALELHKPDIVINASAMKQITTCEYYPNQSVKTNILGVQNLVDAVSRLGTIDTVIGVSTDKACKPINVYGMCKAIQERIYVEANLWGHGTRLVCVRYGNVLESRGSVIPLFKQQIHTGGPVTITLPHMTRFLLSLEESVQLIMRAWRYGLPGDIWIPRTRSARVDDIAQVLIAGRKIPVKTLGIRPGEKIHEILVSEEETFRTISAMDEYVIEPILPELRRHGTRPGHATPVTFQEYSSKDCVLSRTALRTFLAEHGVVVGSPGKDDASRDGHRAARRAKIHSAV